MNLWREANELENKCQCSWGNNRALKNGSLGRWRARLQTCDPYRRREMRWEEKANEGGRGVRLHNTPLQVQRPVCAGQHPICHSTHFYWKPSMHQHGATRWAPSGGDKTAQPFSLFALPKHLSPSQFSSLLSACQNSGDDGGGSDINRSCCRMGVYFEQGVLQTSPSLLLKTVRFWDHHEIEAQRDDAIVPESHS